MFPIESVPIPNAPYLKPTKLLIKQKKIKVWEKGSKISDNATWGWSGKGNKGWIRNVRFLYMQALKPLIASNLFIKYLELHG